MKRSELRRIIKEELVNLLTEGDRWDTMTMDVANAVWGEDDDIDILMRNTPFPYTTPNDARMKIIELLLDYKARHKGSYPNTMNIDSMRRMERDLYMQIKSLLQNKN